MQVAFQRMPENNGLVITMAEEQALKFDRGRRQVAKGKSHIFDNHRRADAAYSPYGREQSFADIQQLGAVFHEIRKLHRQHGRGAACDRWFEQTPGGWPVRWCPIRYGPSSCNRLKPGSSW